ncbi:MAG: type IV toxin-antitoxin system AbiEi family antitoxin domain-containing protein, partial [Jatrophihabitantaceae bacterium]
MDGVPWQAKQQLGVFTVAQALEAGWSRSTLTRYERRGHLVRLRAGAYLEVTELPDGQNHGQALLARLGVAAALRIPAATVSHASAIAAHDLPLLTVPDRPCITLQPPLRTRPWKLHLHRQPIPADQFDDNYGFRLTSVARSCLDHTREFGLADGMAAADAAVHRGLCTPADFEAVYRSSCRGRAGLGSGRKVLQLLDGRSESPLESLSRLSMQGLPPPQTQITIRSVAGTFIARVDFYWEDLGVVGEADGRTKYSDDALWEEKQRQDALTDRGLVVERWGWSDARNPARLRDRLNHAFDRARRL